MNKPGFNGKYLAGFFPGSNGELNNEKRPVACDVRSSCSEGIILALTLEGTYPIGSMYGIFTYIYHKNQRNVGKYTIHGSSGYCCFLLQASFLLENLRRVLVVCGQGAFFAAYTLFYVLTPRIAHRFVGYLEEEAVHTYTEMLKMVDEGSLDLLFGMWEAWQWYMGHFCPHLLAIRVLGFEDWICWHKT